MKLKLIIVFSIIYVLSILLTNKLDEKIDNYYKSVKHPSVFDIGYYYLPNLSKYEII